MSNIVPMNAGRVPAAFAGRSLPDMNAAAQQGIAASFGIVGYKGKVWSIRYRGETQHMVNNNQPIPALNVIIVGISPGVSKRWYDKKYADGDDSPPDCFSVMGDKPDPTSPKIQHPTCAACPQNVFGSRLNDNGKKAKACADYRRIAIVPAGDIDNDSYGSVPMLLNVPAMSLANLAKYGTELQRFGAQPFMVSTELSFNYQVAYPELQFKALGYLDEGSAEKILEKLEDPVIERMFSTSVETAMVPEADDSPASALEGKAPPAAMAAKVTPAPVEVAPAPEPEPVVVAPIVEEDDEEAAAMAALTKARAAKAKKAQDEAFAASAAKAEATKAAAEAARTAAKVAAKTPAPTPAKPNPFAAAGTVPDAVNGEDLTATTPKGLPQAAPADLASAIDALLGS